MFLKIKTLNFVKMNETTITCQIFEEYFFDIVETNGCFDVFFRKKRFTVKNRFLIEHSLCSLVSAKREIRKFLKHFVTSIIEVDMS